MFLHFAILYRDTEVFLLHFQGSITVDFIDITGFDFSSSGPVFSGFANSTHVTTLCSYNGGGDGGGDDCSSLDHSQAKYIYTPGLTMTQVGTGFHFSAPAC